MRFVAHLMEQLAGALALILGGRRVLDRHLLQHRVQRLSTLAAPATRPHDPTSSPRRRAVSC